MNRQIVFTNLIWRLLERLGAQGVTFVVSIVLARLLDPAAYGTIALITIFLSILNVFVDSGMANALIQKKDSDDLDFSSVFWFNLGMCIFLYIIMFFSANFIAKFYHKSELVPLIRVLSIVLIISGIKNVQQAYITKNMQFKKFFIATIWGTIGAAIAGIMIAYLGGGVWALVMQSIFNSVVDTVLLWVTVRWRPKFVFSWTRVKGLLSYGWKLLSSSLIDNVYNNIRQLIIGRMYSADMLGIYNRGKQFPQIISTNVNSSIDSVLFPAMSSEQQNYEKVKMMLKRSIQTSVYVMAPLLMGLASIADTLIPLLLTEKWALCIPYMRVFCVAYVFEPINTASINAIKAIGRSDIFLKLTIVKRCIALLLIIIAMKYGVFAIAVSCLVAGVIENIINLACVYKVLDYKFVDQIKDIFPIIILSVVMGACVYPLKLLKIHAILILVIQVFLGAIIYIFLSYVFHVNSLTYVLGMIKSLIFKKRKGE